MAFQFVLCLLLMSACVLVELKPMSEYGLQSADFKGVSDDNHGCPNGYVSLDSHCYYFSNVSKTWFDAYAYCLQDNAHLASVATSQENVAIKDYLTEYFPVVNGVDGWWFGATDASQEGHWVWTTNQAPVVDADWCSGDPNNDNGEHCGSFNPSCHFQWNDRSCNFWGYRFICEKYVGTRNFDTLP